ncbi:MAG: AMIN domain-containing protein, partial [Desulfobulbaceae bacterium]|nr:AMIN domain-containing protein [Desulfobulbaceae bacterium]
MFLAFLLFFFNGSFSFSQNDNNSGPEEASQTDSTYRKAKDFYYRLERDEAFGNDRGNWLTGVRNFRRLYILDEKSTLAPSCLYNMARIHHSMYHRFKLPIDLDEAIVYYKDVANVFPENSLADDAVFAVAEIYLNEKSDPEKAAQSYATVIERFPDGDKYAQSITRLQDLAKKYNIKLPKKLSGAGSLDHLVNVLPVKYWSSDDYTRIVIRSTEAVQYTTSLLEKDENKPRRLYIDFAQSYIPPRFRAPIPIQDGLLKQVRTGQFNQSTVRVVLDIESISNYKIFSLNDPFRVIVDVHGEKKTDRVVSSNATPEIASTPATASPPETTGTPTSKSLPETAGQNPALTDTDSSSRITIL